VVRKIIHIIPTSVIIWIFIRVKTTHYCVIDLIIIAAWIQFIR